MSEQGEWRKGNSWLGQAQLVVDGNTWWLPEWLVDKILRDHEIAANWEVADDLNTGLVDEWIGKTDAAEADAQAGWALAKEEFAWMEALPDAAKELEWSDKNKEEILTLISKAKAALKAREERQNGT